MLTRTRFLAVLSVLAIFAAWAAPARALQVGQRASNFRLKTAHGKLYTLASFKQPLILIWYEGSKSRYQNTWAKNLGRRLRDSGKLDPKLYIGIGMANFPEHWASNWIIRQVIKSKQKNDRTIILCDESGEMQKLWGFRNGRSNIYLLDHQRRLRWKSSGPLSKRRALQMWRLVLRLIQQYRAKPPAK